MDAPAPHGNTTVALLAALPDVVLKSMQQVETDGAGLKGPEKKAKAIALVQARLAELAALDGQVSLSEALITALVPPMIERLVAVQNGALSLSPAACCGGFFAATASVPPIV
jgi:hypothetical protein